MSTDFSFFDDIVGRAVAKPSTPPETQPEAQPEAPHDAKAAWPEQPAIPAAPKKPVTPISFEASRFSSDHWNPEQNTVPVPDEPLGTHRQLPQRRRPRPLSAIGEVPEAPKQAVEQVAAKEAKEELKPLLPAPSAEEFARARRKEMANRIQPQEVSESSRAWSKTVEAIRAI